MKSPPEKEAGVGAYDLKAEDIVDEIEPNACSSLSKEGRTVINKLIKDMTPLCSICNVDLKKFAEKDEFAVREDLKANVEFIQTNLQYNVRKD